MQLSDLVGQTIASVTYVDVFKGEGQLIKLVTTTGQTFMIRGGYGEGAYLCDQRYLDYLDELGDDDDD